MDIEGVLLMYGIKLELKHIPVLVHHGIIKCTDPITWPIYWPEMEKRFPINVVKFAHSSNLWEQLYYIIYGHDCDILTLPPEINKLIMDYTICGEFGERVLELVSESWLPMYETGQLLDNWISSKDWHIICHTPSGGSDDDHELYIGSSEFFAFGGHGKKWGSNIDTQLVDEMLNGLDLEEANPQFIFFNSSSHGNAWRL